MSKQTETSPKDSKLSLPSIISGAIQIPGVKVNRDEFLREQFKNYSPDKIAFIVAEGPVAAGCKREELHKMSQRIIKARTAISSSASFIAGVPGGIAMAATIPADILQFYGMALRMAQELAYLYGETDMWCDGTVNGDKVTNQLILYCGVMLGASGAAQAIRILSAALAKQALTQLPKKALTKALYYTITKNICKYFGIKLTKSAFAKGVSKAIPIVGGVVSSGITLASMLPMGNRLAKALDKAHFDYSQSDLDSDINEIKSIWEESDDSVIFEDDSYMESEQDPFYKEDEENTNPPQDPPSSQEDILTQIQKAKELHSCGILTDEEFSEIKAKLIAQI